MIKISGSVCSHKWQARVASEKGCLLNSGKKKALFYKHFLACKNIAWYMYMMSMHMLGLVAQSSIYFKGNQECFLVHITIYETQKRLFSHNKYTVKNVFYSVMYILCNNIKYKKTKQKQYKVQNYCTMCKGLTPVHVHVYQVLISSLLAHFCLWEDLICKNTFCANDLGGRLVFEKITA